MINLRIAIYFLCSIISVILISCGRPSDDDLIDAALRFNKGDEKSNKKLEDLFFRRIEISKIDNKILLADSFLFIENDSEIAIKYPIKKTFAAAGKRDFLYITISDDRMAYTDGNSIYCCDDETDPLYTSSDNNIRSLIIIGDEIYFYNKFQLFRVSIKSKENVRIVNESFFPPYKKLFNANFRNAGSLIGISSGIAGSYNISIVDIRKKSIIMSNIQSASSAFAINEDSIWYLGGSTGNWEVTKINLATKNKKIIQKINDINNFVITSNGYVYENNEGIHISNYLNDPINLPLRYRLMGICGDTIIMKYDTIILTDFMTINNNALLINKVMKQ